MNLPDISKRLRYASRFPLTRYGLTALPIALVLLLIMVFFFWLPVANRNQELLDSVEHSRRDLVSIMRLNELSTEYKSTLQAVEQIESKLDRVIPLSEFVERLNGLARDNQVQIINESRHVGKQHNGYLPIYQELVLEAGYSSIRQFLSGLSTLPTWTVVKEMRLAKQRDSGQLKANLVLVTFQKQSGETVE